MNLDFLSDHALREFIKLNTDVGNNITNADRQLLLPLVNTTYTELCQKKQKPKIPYNSMMDSELRQFAVQHGLEIDTSVNSDRDYLIASIDKLYNLQCGKTVTMNDLTDLELQEFLSVYQIDISGTHDLLVQKAVNLYNSIQNTNAHVTYAILDLLVAQKYFTGQEYMKYTEFELENLSNEDVLAFSRLFNLDSNAPNVKERIYRILRMKDLIEIPPPGMIYTAGSFDDHDYLMSLTIPEEFPIIETLPPGWCVHSIQNRRDYQEDRYNITTYNGITIYAIYDGHAGSGVSNDAARRLPYYIYQQISYLQNYPTTDEIAVAIKVAFIEYDEMLFEDTDIQGGSTATLIVKVRDNYYFANLGDSRTIWVNNGELIFETKDHKPDDLFEKYRIESAGGVVRQSNNPYTKEKYGPMRVNGELAVSRAFGDYKYKVGIDGKMSSSDDKVIAFPSVTVMPAKAGTFILASDGLWDVISSIDVAKFVNDSKINTCELLVDFAKSNPMNADNITVLMGPS